MINPKIEWIPGLSNLFFNGSGIAKGFETLIQKKINKYTGWISYTFTDAENTYPLLNDGNPFPAPQIQRNEFKVFNNYEINGWNFSIPLFRVYIFFVNSFLFIPIIESINAKLNF